MKYGRTTYMVVRVETQDICFICGAVEYLAQNFPIYCEMIGVYKEQSNNVGMFGKPYLKTYNLDWRNHPTIQTLTRGLTTHKS